MGVTAIPYDSNGNFSLVPGYLAVSGQTILASQHNPPFEDIAAGMSQVLLRSGAAPMSGNLSAAGFKITGAGAGAADGDYVTMAQLNAVVASVTANAVPTGARQGFFRTTAPTGWIKGNGGTIGSAASGATTRANADTLNLFTLFWDQFSNTILPIQTGGGVASTRGASAAADFAANKRLPVFDLRSRYDRGADDGLAFDATATVGAIQADAIKNHVHPGNTTATTGKTLGGMTDYGGAQTGGAGTRIGSGGAIGSIDIPALPFTTDANTGGLALETRVRTVVTLHCIKL
jgi:hypothetical protein